MEIEYIKYIKTVSSIFLLNCNFRVTKRGQLKVSLGGTGKNPKFTFVKSFIIVSALQVRGMQSCGSSRPHLSQLTEKGIHIRPQDRQVVFEVYEVRLSGFRTKIG